MNKENAKSIATASGILLGLFLFTKGKDWLEEMALTSDGKCEICNGALYVGKSHECRNIENPSVFERFQNDFARFLETPMGQFQEYLAKNARRNSNQKEM